MAPKMTIRPGVATDLDAMIEITEKIYDQDPNYRYRFPNRHLHPADFINRYRSKYSKYLEDGIVVVCELPQEAKVVVAFSVWIRQAPPKWRLRRTASPQGSLPSSTGASAGTLISPPKALERDADLAHVKAFFDACESKRHEFFDSRYPRGYMFLKLLLCHPDYQRRGFGTALTTWGINAARRQGVPATVFASPMGFQLYLALNFEQVGCFRVQTDGDDEHLDIPVLVSRRRSVRRIKAHWASARPIEQVA